MTIKSILIASDLSERSDRALQRGLRLAKEVEARVTVTSIIDDATPEAFAGDLVQRGQAHLEACVQALNMDVPCEITVERGDPLTRLVELASSDTFDLLVVGRHRSRGLFDGLSTTTVENVVARSRTPVLMVVAPAAEAYARVLAPVSFSAACHQAVTLSRDLAPDASFKIYHAWLAPFEGLTGGKGSSYARAVQHETEREAASWAVGLPAGLPDVELVQHSVGASLHGQVQAFSPDLIAIGATTRALSFAGLGSFSAELVRDPPADLFVARGARPA